MEYRKTTYLEQIWYILKWKLRQRFCRHRFKPGTTDVKWHEDTQTHTITETCCKCGKQFSFDTPYLNSIEYATSELAKIGGENDSTQAMMNKHILEIIETFFRQGHSGFSAGYALSVLERLLRFKPLTPLTGEEDEWNEVSHGTQQNKRCSSVFRHEDGTATDVDAIVVSDNGGITWFTSVKFRKKISFPYTPPIHAEKVYIEYTEDVPPGFTGDKYDIITDCPDRIKALYERKRVEFDEAYAEEE